MQRWEFELSHAHHRTRGIPSHFHYSALDLSDSQNKVNETEVNF